MQGPLTAFTAVAFPLLEYIKLPVIHSLLESQGEKPPCVPLYVVAPIRSHTPAAQEICSLEFCQ